MSRVLRRSTLLAALILIVALRVVYPDSDPYRRLDWDTGILTDEGFYSLNARNLVLFGHARLDEFNNMLVAPLVHCAQAAVFVVFGSGAVQARMISVVASLLTIVVFYAAMRRAFGIRIAATAAFLLGLDHANALFNRLALLDTPATLGAVCAFYAFVRAIGNAAEPRWARAPSRADLTVRDDVRSDRTAPANAGDGTSSRDGARALHPWLLMCAIIVVLTAANRSLAAYLIPVPFLSLWLGLKGPRIRIVRSFVWLAAGLLAALAAYLALWYALNQAELAHMAHYYRTTQVMPESFGRLLYNIRLHFLGEKFGYFPYVFRHTPVVFSLALVGLSAIPCAIRTGTMDDGRWTMPGDVHMSSGTEQSSNGPSEEKQASGLHAIVAVYFLAFWLISSWLVLAVSNYSPDRYFVSTYPALFGLAAITFWKLKEVGGILAERNVIASTARGVLAWVLTYHAVEAILHRDAVMPEHVTNAILFAKPALIAIAAALGPWLLPKRAVNSKSDDGRWTIDGDKRAKSIVHRPSSIVHNPSSIVRSVLLVSWVLVNGVWLFDWVSHVEYTQRDVGRWLEANLPANSVLLGDVAPGLAMDTKLLAVNVMKGLCNDRDPVQRFANRPIYIVLLDSPNFRSLYWVERYPELIDPSRRMKHVRVIKWMIGIYPGNSP